MIYIPIATVTVWITQGFVFRATRSILKNDYSIPNLNNFGDMVKKGIKLWAISIIYTIIMIIFIIILIIMVYFSYLINPTLAMILGILFGIIGIIALVLLSYILPMAITHVIATDNFKEGFNIKKILKISFTSTYFVTFLIAIFYNIIAGLIILIIIIPLLITIVGWIFWLTIAGIAVQITQYTFYMDTYKEITANEKLKISGVNKDLNFINNQKETKKLPKNKEV